MPNILLTSIGRRVELVRWFREAFARQRLAGQIVATDVDWLAPALQFVDHPYLVPRWTSNEFIPVLERICRDEQIDLVLPLIDPDVPVLAEAKSQLAATGAKLAVVDAAAARIAGDKWAANQWFLALGLEAPRSWLPHQIDATRAPYPLFIKPRGGSAAESTFPIRTADELNFFVDYVREPIVQEYLPGPEVTCDVICDLHGTVLAVVQRQRISVRGGEVTKSVTIQRSDVDEICRHIASKLPAVGPITIQFMLKEDRPLPIEINARLGGGLPLAIAAGLDVPGILLAMAAGNDPLPLVTSYETDMTMTRFDDSVFLTRDDRERIEGRRI